MNELFSYASECLHSMALISRTVYPFHKNKGFFFKPQGKVNFGESLFQRSMKYHIIFSHFTEGLWKCGYMWTLS